MQRVRKTVTTDMVPTARKVTPSTMKRVGGGSGRQARPTTTATITARTMRANTPRNETVATTTRVLRTTSARTISTGRTSTLARVPETKTTATRRAFPVMTPVTVSVRRMGATAASTTTRASVVRSIPTMTTQPRQSEVARLKRDNAQLSRGLVERTTQLQDATEQVCKINTDLDDAMKTHEEDGFQLKQLTDEQKQLKLDMLKSRTMVQDLMRNAMEEIVELETKALAFPNASKADKELNSKGAVANEAAETKKSYQRAPLHGHQIHLEHDLITSLKMKVNMLELKLKNSEYNNEVLQMHLDKTPYGNWKSDEKRDFVPDWNTSGLEYQLQSYSDNSWTSSASSQ
ncbi:unnamed protein product [Albugo candida]|uniref:Uncharacterized protein n=1 Tax=Albugo candida TaxID=65357 RepID=A0A024GVF7_9STRA|nr:unnamed protein product [Albugo candida]|eukprot:CCI50823.1 unnamed protein product [Albugo candida]